jgi:perosamine synthetase
MKPIFASLGSNYNSTFAWVALQQLFRPSLAAPSLLSQKLASTFKNQVGELAEVRLFYKGRDAIHYALKRLDLPQDSQVLTQAFTCFALEEAIVQAGLEPVYVDIGPETVNLTPATLSAALKKAPRTQALIVQHSMGMPADSEAIRRWCDEQKIILIEDLAQAFGSVTNRGTLLGMDGDVVICSFGRDKVLDAVSGGASLIRKTRLTKKLLQISRNQADQIDSPALDKLTMLKDMFYPTLTFLIRRTYQIGLGKVFFRLGRALGLLTSPVVNPAKPLTRLPAAYAHLALWQWQHLDQQLAHRRQVAQYYHEQLTKRSRHKDKLQLFATDHQIRMGSNLRFVMAVESPEKLVEFLKQNEIYCADRWYRQAVDCGKLSCQTAYQVGRSPNAEKLAARVVNLPTHQEVGFEEMERVVNAVLLSNMPNLE